MLRRAAAAWPRCAPAPPVATVHQPDLPQRRRPPAAAARTQRFRQLYQQLRPLGQPAAGRLIKTRPRPPPPQSSFPTPQAPAMTELLPRHPAHRSTEGTASERAAEPSATTSKNRLVLGKPMKPSTCGMAVCYWHSFCWPGTDPFGDDGTLLRPWFQKLGMTDPMDQARAPRPWPRSSSSSKLGAAVTTASTTATSRPKAPRRARARTTCRRMVDVLGRKHQQRHRHPAAVGHGQRCSATAVSMSWRRHQPRPRRLRPGRAAGARRTGGHPGGWAAINYVLWGGREGYETLLNTDIEARKLDQLGRFLQTWWWSTSTGSACQGFDPDRAQAARADQAPVRLRHRQRLRLPGAATASRRK